MHLFSWTHTLYFLDKATIWSNMKESIGLQYLCGLDAALSPRTPREPVPSVPPVG